MVIGMQRGMFFRSVECVFLLRAAMSLWLWGGRSIFHIQSSFGMTRTRTSKNCLPLPAITGLRGQRLMKL